MLLAHDQSGKTHSMTNMATPSLRLAEDGLDIVASYAIDVDINQGLDQGHLDDLIDLLRNHATAQQLRTLLNEIRQLLTDEQRI